MSCDPVTREIGQKMLEGWKMLGTHCPLCFTVLLQAKGDTKRYCCSCKAYLVTEEEAKEHKLTITDSVENIQQQQQQEEQKQKDQEANNSDNTQVETTETSNKKETDQEQQKQSKTVATAQVDLDFDKMDDEEENALSKTKSDYESLKSLYSSLMSSSGAFLNRGGYTDDVDTDKDSAPTSSMLNMFNSLDKFSQQLEQNATKLSSMGNTAPTKPSTTTPAPALPQSKKPQLSQTLQQEQKEELQNQNNTKKYTPQQTPPDPDEDWEYYNSRDTDIPIRLTSDGGNIDPVAMKAAEDAFSAKLLQGWIFSAHTCMNCKTVMLLPPRFVEHDDIEADIVQNQNTYEMTKKAQNVVQSVSLDSCEYLRGLCTYCGWYCIEDDGYVNTIEHDCCYAQYGEEKQNVTTSQTTTKNNNDTTTAQPTTKSIDVDNWQSNVKNSIQNAIQKVLNADVDDDYDYEDEDDDNFAGLEETKKILESQWLQDVMKERDTVTAALGQEMLQNHVVLDEYCPDCYYPLVALEALPNNMSSNAANKAIADRGLYATLKKKCVWCKQTWNVDNTDDVVVKAGTAAVVATKKIDDEVNKPASRAPLAQPPTNPQQQQQPKPAVQNTTAQPKQQQQQTVPQHTTTATTSPSITTPPVLARSRKNPRTDRIRAALDNQLDVLAACLEHNTTIFQKDLVKAKQSEAYVSSSTFANSNESVYPVIEQIYDLLDRIDDGEDQE